MRHTTAMATAAGWAMAEAVRSNQAAAHANHDHARPRQPSVSTLGIHHRRRAPGRDTGREPEGSKKKLGRGFPSLLPMERQQPVQQAAPARPQTSQGLAS